MGVKMDDATLRRPSLKIILLKLISNYHVSVYTTRTREPKRSDSGHQQAPHPAWNAVSLIVTIIYATLHPYIPPEKFVLIFMTQYNPPQR